MCSHFIILSSSYSAGERIALDFTDFSKDINSIIKRIKQECGEDVSISTHGINADDTTWEGVKRADPFFQDVRLIKNVDEFIRLIKQDRILSGTDIAKYILSVVGNCTHLKLEKLVYFCYADYICGTCCADAESVTCKAKEVILTVACLVKFIVKYRIV